MFRGSRFAKVMRLWLAAMTLLVSLSTFGQPTPVAAASDLGLEMPEEVDFGRLRIGQSATPPHDAETSLAGISPTFTQPLRQSCL